jgi:hypothetical protein
VKRRYAGCNGVAPRCNVRPDAAALHLHRPLVLIERCIGYPASAAIDLSPSVSSRESSLPLAGLPNPPSTRFYFDGPIKFAPEQIVVIEVAGPLPYGADLTAVFNFIGQRVSNARVNLRVHAPVKKAARKLSLR